MSTDFLGAYDFKENNSEATNTSQSNTTNNGNANNGNGNNKPAKTQRSKGQQNKSPAKNKSNSTAPAANGQQVIVNGSSAPDADSA